MIAHHGFLRAENQGNRPVHNVFSQKNHIFLLVALRLRCTLLEINGAPEQFLRGILQSAVCLNPAGGLFADMVHHGIHIQFLRFLSQIAHIRLKITAVSNQIHRTIGIHIALTQKNLNQFNLPACAADALNVAVQHGLLPGVLYLNQPNFSV